MYQLKPVNSILIISYGLDMSIYIIGKYFEITITNSQEKT